MNADRAREFNLAEPANKKPRGGEARGAKKIGVSVSLLLRDEDVLGELRFVV